MGNPLETENASSEKAAASGERQRAMSRQQRQKDQMAQKQGTASKSNVVYASEDYFTNLRNRVELSKAQDDARVDWRKDLEEHRGAPAAEAEKDEGNHPYVDIMPHTNPHEKKKEKAVQNASKDDSNTYSEEVLVEGKGPCPRTGEKVCHCEDLNDIPKQLEKSTKMHAKQAKMLRKAGIGESFEEAFGRLVDESALNPFQYHPSKGGTDTGTPEQAKKIAKNLASNRKKGPMSRDPFKARRGESD